MKHPIFILLLIFFLTYTSIFGQSFSDCNIQGPVFIKIEEASKFSGSLQVYFENEFKDMYQATNGTILLQILIDTSGRVCCGSIENKTSNISSIKIKDVVNKMTGWLPAKTNNHLVNFAVTLLITFKDSKLNVDYINEKPPVFKPIINPNTFNNPDVVKERKTKTIWKLWNFKNSMLPSNLSRNVAIDSNDIIWCCTDNGLVRISDDVHWEIFDGINVQALSGKNNTTSTTGMVIDKVNNVWVESGGHIVKYDGEKWTTFDTSNSPLKAVHKMYVDKDGVIWFCVLKGIIKYDGKNWTKYNTSNSKIASDNVNDVYVGNDETIWIATDKGINKVVLGNWSLFNEENSNLQGNNVTCLKGDAAGNIWAGAETSGKYYLIKIDSANNIGVNISVLLSSAIWNITVDNNTNKVWLATHSNGLVAYNGKEFVQYDNSNSIIPNNIISDILIDTKGNKWVSTFGGLVFTNIK